MGYLYFEDFLKDCKIKEAEDDLKKKSLPKKLQKQRLSVEKLPKSFAFRKK